MATENHNLQDPDYNSVDWHFDWYANTEHLDTAVEIRDEEANLSDYTPKNGAKFFATDTGAVYLGINDAWEPAPHPGGDVEYDTITAATINVDNFTADNQLILPIYDETANAPQTQGSLIYVTGAVDNEGIYKHDGSSYTRLTGGTSGVAGTGGTYSTTGDGTTTSFTFDTGIEPDDGTQFEWVNVDPATSPASTDYAISTSGSNITIDYAEAPTNGDDLEWFWVVSAGSGGGDGAGALSELSIDTDKSWQGYRIYNAGELSASVLTGAGVHQIKDADPNNVLTDTSPNYIALADASATDVNLSGRVTGSQSNGRSAGSVQVSLGEDADGWVGTHATQSLDAPDITLIEADYDISATNGDLSGTGTAIMLRFDVPTGAGWTDATWSGTDINGAIQAVDSSNVSNETIISPSGSYHVNGHQVWHEGTFDPTNKADTPHDNTAHSTDYSAVGHDHSGDAITPDSINTNDISATSATVSNAPSSDIDTVRLTDLNDYYERSGDFLTGSMNANNYSIRNINETDVDLIQVSDAIDIPVHDGQPDSGSLWFRSDL